MLTIKCELRLVSELMMLTHQDYIEKTIVGVHSEANREIYSAYLEHVVICVTVAGAVERWEHLDATGGSRHINFFGFDGKHALSAHGNDDSWVDEMLSGEARLAFSRSLALASMRRESYSR